MIRRFENMEYYNGYTENTLPRVRGSQYNPMIKDERKSLMEDILNQLDSDINGYINGRGLLVDDSGIGVWSSFDSRESGDNLDKVKLFCDIDDGNGGVRDLAEHDVFIDWDSFMDSYDIESDVVSYVEDEAKKWFKTCVRSFNRNTRESKIRRTRVNESNFEYREKDLELLSRAENLLLKLRNSASGQMATFFQDLAYFVRSFNMKCKKGSDGDTRNSEYLLKKEYDKIGEYLEKYLIKH